MKEFNNYYSETLSDLRRSLRELDLSIFSKHNQGYQSYQTADKLISAFQEEKNRYKKSFDFILSLQTEGKIHRILDVGCLFGILPMILRKALINTEIHVIENYSFYGKTLDPIQRLLRSCDIDVVDADAIEGIPFSDNYFSLVTLLAVVEHLSSSPLSLLKETKRILEEDGYLIMDTPNVCSMTKRISFLLHGNPPYPDIEDFLFSETPFTGHSREYSEKDVIKLLGHSGFEIAALTQFNIGTFRKTNLRGLILQRVLPGIFRGLSNYIWCAARSKDEPSTDKGKSF
jgi:SAM-dependent methyltransferase